MNAVTKSVGAVLVAVGLWAGAAAPVLAYELDLQDILKQGLLGAGTGAISAGASGGKAGKGALIGAGTGILGNLIAGFLTSPSRSQAPVSYAQPVAYYEPAPAPVYAAPQPVSYQPAYYAPPAPASDPNKQILKSGLLGAGVGAISAEASGGKAGTGALVGAGTNVIGGALFDTLFSPSPSQSGSPSYAAYPARSNTPVRHILRKFDSNGKLISEEEYWE